MGDLSAGGPRGLEEQIGAAVCTSHLTLDPEHDESHLVRIAAIGGAARRISEALDVLTPLEPKERDRIEARLAPLLWRVKYGADVTHETTLDTVRLFARWLTGTGSWCASPATWDMTQRWAAQAIDEWLSDRCPYCAGTGLQELLRNGGVRRPIRFGDPKVSHVQCHACHGTRRARPNAMDRARSLQIPLVEYRKDWARRMDRAGQQLGAIARRLKKPLQFELERDYNRA